MSEQTHSIEERLTKLEAKYQETNVLKLTDRVFVLSSIAMGAAFFCAIKGFDLPSHPYQGAFAVLVVFFLYHRKFISMPDKLFHWVLPLLNALSITVVMKIFVSSGFRQPFEWVQYPIVSMATGEGKWINIPKLVVNWSPSTLALWTVDLTQIQLFLLIMVFVGAVLRFQLFASLVAFTLLLSSMPALVEFDWSWVFPAILTFIAGIYLQATPRSL